MYKRMAAVDAIYTISVEYSAIFNIGDTISATPRSKGIALQKEGDFFTKKDSLYFQDYPIFKRKANFLEKKRPVNTRTIHHGNIINVQQISIIGLSQSAVFQVGSINHIDSEARTKHIRKLKERP